MPIQPSLRSMPFYDLLATLIPGAFLLFLAVFLSGVQLGQISTGAYALILLVGGYITGRTLRRVGRKMEGRPYLFGSYLEAVSEGEAQSPSNNPPAVERAFRFVFPDSVASANHPKKEPAILRFNEVFGQIFDVDPEKVGKGEKLKMTLAYLETQPEIRGLRYQSLHTFHRNMWAACVILMVWSLVIAVVVITKGIYPWNLGVPGVVLPDIYYILATFFIATYLSTSFYKQKHAYDLLFVKYAMRDLYSCAKTRT